MARETHFVLRETVRGQVGAALGDQVVEHPADGRSGAALIGVAIVQVHRVVPDRRDRHAERAQPAGRARDQYLADAQRARQLRGVQAARAAAGHHHVVARVDAALDRHRANGRRHVRVHDGDDPGRGLAHAQVQRDGDVRLDRRVRQIRIQRAPPAQKRAGGHASDRQVGVGHRGFVTPARVARRPGLRAGAVRADAQGVATVEPGEGAAARADRQHFHPVDADGLVGDLDVGGHDRLAVAQHAHVEAGAAHVHHDQPAGRLRIRRIVGAGRGAGRRPGGDRVDRPGQNVWDGRATAVHLHDERCARQAAVLHGRLEGAQIVADDGRDEGAQDGRRSAFPLADFGQHVARTQHRHPGQFLAHDLRAAPLVAAVHDGPQIGDGHGLHAVRAQPAGRGADRVFVERRDFAAVRGGALRNAEAQIARHEVLGFGQVDVEAFRLPAVAQVGDVAETLRAQQADFRAAALDQRVGRHGLAVHQELGRAQQVGHVGAGFGSHAGQPARDRQQGLVRGRVFLVDVEGAVVPEHDHVGERAADVDAYAVSHESSFPAPLKSRATVGASR